MITGRVVSNVASSAREKIKGRKKGGKENNKKKKKRKTIANRTGKRRSSFPMEKKKSKLWILHSRPPCRSQLPEIGGSWATSKSRRNSTSSSSDNDEKTSRTEEEEMERNGRRMETTRRRWTERRRLVDSAKHEEINKSTSEAVSWVEKWKKTIDVVGWRRITGAGRRATRERIRNRVVYIYICATRSSFSSFSYFLSLWLHSNVRTRKENAFSLSRSRGESIFSATSGNGKEAFSRGAAEIQPWRAEDTRPILRTRNSLHGSQRSVHVRGRDDEYLSRLFRFELRIDRNLRIVDVNSFARSKKMWIDESWRNRITL